MMINTQTNGYIMVFNIPIMCKYIHWKIFGENDDGKKRSENFNRLKLELWYSRAFLKPPIQPHEDGFEYSVKI